MRTVKIAEREIGDGLEPFIVAEVGINHNGDVDKALQMVKVAKDAGVDAVKFQTFTAEEFCGDPQQTYTYTSQGRTVTEPMLEMFKRHEFSPEQWKRIKDECERLKIIFFSTPQNRSDLNLLLKLGVPAIKVGSDDFTNLPQLRDYAKAKLPMILSCGMSHIGEVHQALSAVGALDGAPTILLLCTSQYPTPPRDANLRKIATLRAAFTNVPIGFSDHTQGALAASVAVGLGACFFEKHFTLDRNLPGPDHWFSEDPSSLAQWCGAIRTAYEMLGSSIVRATAVEESKMKTIARRSIVAIADIAPGVVLDESNIGLRRPGNGLSPALFEAVLGKVASRTVRKGELLKLGDFC